MSDMNVRLGHIVGDNSIMKDMIGWYRIQKTTTSKY